MTAAFTPVAPPSPALAALAPDPRVTVDARPDAHRPARWPHVALAVLMVTAGVVYSMGIHLGLIHNYYGTAVYSMAHSWKAFFWGSFDGSTITMDKIPGAFWVQALSVRLFGWSNWSVLMPQVLQAVAAIGVLYATVRRWAGDIAALLAAAALATTPVLAALAHSQIVDTQLMLLTVAAAWAWTRAMQAGSGRWLALAGVFVGLGFNAKMAQAWGVLPALAISYLLFAPGKPGRRQAPQAPGGMPGGTASTSQASSDLAWIAQNNPGSQYDLIVLDYGTAGQYITAGGRVVSAGGFTGQMSNLTLDELKSLVSQGKVTHVLVSSAGGGMGGPGGASSTETASSQISSWVTENCTAVDGHDGLYTCS